MTTIKWRYCCTRWRKDLQEVVYTLMAEYAQFTFDQCIQALDVHFVPQVNKVMFFDSWNSRQIKQWTIVFLAYVKKDTSCYFSDVDKVTRDKVIEKCMCKHLRRKFIETSGNKEWCVSRV